MSSTNSVDGAHMGYLREERYSRMIAKVIGRRLGLPIESRDREHFGWFASFAGADMSASSERTRTLLGWKPTGPGLLTDIDQPSYFKN